MKKTKLEKGITLIALIITIVVLLILAVVTIGAIQESKIIAHSKNAATSYNYEKGEENTILQNYIDYIDKHNPNNKPSAFDSITAENYGDSITYSAGNISDWKVFYKDDNYLYIITSDYLNVDDLPSSVTANVDEGYPYGVNFISTTSTTINDDVAEKFMLSWWKRTDKTSLSNYSRSIYELLNTSVWSEFAGGISGAEAIGAPTLEMWIASWNSQGYTKLYCNNQDKFGYFVGKTSGDTGIDLGLKTDTDGYANSLYFPHTTTVKNCSGYWLSSPVAGDSNTVYVFYINSDGGIISIYGDGSECLGMYDWSEVGTRPVVALPANVITTNTDGTLAVIQ